MAVRGDIRNVAIVAHVDHGKTTLVNAMLAQSHVFNEREEVPDRVMDSNDLEREKGITILAKNTAVQYTGPLAAKYGHPEGITLNIIDTPGHADFGGEVERGISMVDGVVLLVDASEGPLPQTRFVLRKALEAKLPVILCVNKTDRPDARIEEVVGESSDLLLGLAQDVIEEGIDLDEDALFDLPVIYCAAKAGYASENQPENGGLPDNEDLEPLFEAIIKNIPAPEYEEGAPLQAHVANIDSSDFLGRLGLVRIYNGTLEKGKTYGLSRVDGSVENFRVSELLRTQGYQFDLAYTSVLKRAIHTLWITLDAIDQDWLPVRKSWRLNERHYGALQGLNKSETAEKYGEKQVLIWRRSYDIRPGALEKDSPMWPGKDPRYADIPEAEIPACECLKDTVARVIPFWEESIKPEVASGKRVLIAAHGNSLRALIKHLDGISDEDIAGLNIPTAQPLVYEFDDDMKPIRHYYLGNQEEIAKAIAAVAAQGKAKH